MPGAANEEAAMALYLYRFSYTPEAWAALVESREDRRDMLASRLFGAFGGRLQGLWYSFGEWDGYVLAELPDSVSAAAASAAVIATGSFRNLETTVLRRRDARGARPGRGLRIREPRASTEPRDAGAHTERLGGVRARASGSVDAPTDPSSGDLGGRSARTDRTRRRRRHVGRPVAEDTAERRADRERRALQERRRERQADGVELTMLQPPVTRWLERRHRRCPAPSRRPRPSPVARLMGDRSRGPGVGASPYEPSGAIGPPERPKAVRAPRRAVVARSARACGRRCSGAPRPFSR
jgi:uncharacterized protein with GYD domain